MKVMCSAVLMYCVGCVLAVDLLAVGLTPFAAMLVVPTIPLVAMLATARLVAQR